MAAGKRRSKSRKVVDKWKMKSWYSVVAKDGVFENKIVGEVVSSDPDNLINRIVKVSLMDLTGKMSQNSIYTTLKYRIYDVKEKNAYARLIGHEMAMSYLRSLARRRRSVIHEVVDITTKDNKQVRIKTLLVTQKKVSAIVKKNLRKALVDKIKGTASSRDYPTLMADIFSGKFSKELYQTLNPINPIMKVEIKKTELGEKFE